MLPGGVAWVWSEADGWADDSKREKVVEGFREEEEAV
jgi:hypothetical protein